MKHGIFELPLNLKRSHFSYAHTDDDVDRLLEATEEAVADGAGSRGDDRPGGHAARSTSTAPGKQVGRLQFPKISNTAGWAYNFVPIATIANGDGPTVLVSGGNHGDEYEGQIAALRLDPRAAAEQVHGRIVVIPVISTDASKANTRMWPSGRELQPLVPGLARRAARTSSSPTTSPASCSRWPTS